MPSQFNFCRKKEFSVFVIQGSRFELNSWQLLFYATVILRSVKDFRRENSDPSLVENNKLKIDSRKERKKEKKFFLFFGWWNSRSAYKVSGNKSAGQGQVADSSLRNSWAKLHFCIFLFPADFTPLLWSFWFISVANLAIAVRLNRIKFCRVAYLTNEVTVCEPWWMKFCERAHFLRLYSSHCNLTFKIWHLIFPVLWTSSPNKFQFNSSILKDTNQSPRRKKYTWNSHFHNYKLQLIFSSLTTSLPLIIRFLVRKFSCDLRSHTGWWQIKFWIKLSRFITVIFI